MKKITDNLNLQALLGVALLVLAVYVVGVLL